MSCAHARIAGRDEFACLDCGMIRTLYPAAPGLACWVWHQPHFPPTEEALEEARKRAIAARERIREAA
jgi:hypothetical protein